ncbi:MAG TPA: FmdB family zinc ribbon protein [Thermoleophilaceae bacterium]|jgi:putative FmdB family regulatory protein
MPLYDYRCENGHTFEVMQRMSADPITVCQECGAPVQRVLHAPAVHFKGSGFYTTDYGRKKSGAGSSSSDDSGSSSSSSSSESKKSDSKSDSGSSTKSESKSSSSSD